MRPRSTIIQSFTIALKINFMKLEAVLDRSKLIKYSMMRKLGIKSMEMKVLHSQCQESIFLTSITIEILLDLLVLTNL